MEVAGAAEAEVAVRAALANEMAVMATGIQATAAGEDPAARMAVVVADMEVEEIGGDRLAFVVFRFRFLRYVLF